MESASIFFFAFRQPPVLVLLFRKEELVLLLLLLVVFSFLLFFESNLRKILYGAPQVCLFYISSRVFLSKVGGFTFAGQNVLATSCVGMNSGGHLFFWWAPSSSDNVANVGNFWLNRLDFLGRFAGMSAFFERIIPRLMHSVLVIFVSIVVAGRTNDRPVEGLTHLCNQSSENSERVYQPQQ